MQVEISLQEKSLQTSPRDEYSKPEEQNVLAADIVPNVAENLVQNIVCTMPISIATETQGTSTETVKTGEGITQTTPRDEVLLKEGASSSNASAEPYEIHIQASFIIPDDATTHNTTEIQKSYVIDETQPGLVREIESTSEEKDKKSKSKSKKKKKKSKTTDSKESPGQSSIVENVPCVDNENLTNKKNQPEQKTFATLKITKTTVYETSNLLGKVNRPHDSAISIEGIVSNENVEVPFSQGNRKKSKTNLMNS